MYHFQVTKKLNEGTQFDIVVANQVISRFTGDYKALTAFLTVIEILYKPLKAEERRILIKYVCDVKLSYEVRLAVSAPEIPDNLEELKERLQKRYRNPATAIEIYRTLCKLKQNDMSILEFRDRINELVDELNSLYSPNSNRIALVKRSDYFAVQLFARGANDQLRRHLSTDFSNLDEIVSKALDIEEQIRNDSNAIDQTNTYVAVDIEENHSSDARNSNESVHVCDGGVDNDSCSISISRNFILMECKNSINSQEPMSFLLCPASPISICKRSKINLFGIFYSKRTHETSYMNGIEIVPSIGSLNLSLMVEHDVTIKHCFNVVNEDYKMATDCLLGTDFFTHFRCTINYQTMALILEHQKRKFSLPIKIEN